jgi:folate-binding protein YgfZ
MRLYKLKDTIVLHLQGNAAKFLNGLTTNTLDTPFNAFVNQHGRIVAVFRQHKVSDEEFFIAVPALAVEVLLKHLSMYAKISGTKIEITSNKAYIDVDSGEWFFKPENLAPQVSEEEFVLYRLNNNLPLQGRDYQADEFILNVDSGQFVSFTKGCFLGQEPVSKVHNRSKPSRKLVVQSEDAVPPEERVSLTSKAKDPQTGTTRGFIFVRNI